MNKKFIFTKLLPTSIIESINIDKVKFIFIAYVFI